MFHKPIFKIAAILEPTEATKEGLSLENQDFRQLEVTLDRLKRTVNELRYELDAVDEQVEAVDAEVRLNMATLLEKNQLLRFRSDPFANNGNSLANWDELSA